MTIERNVMMVVTLIHTVNSVWKDLKNALYLIGSSKEAFWGGNLLVEIFDKGKNLRKRQSYMYTEDVVGTSRSHRVSKALGA